MNSKVRRERILVMAGLNFIVLLFVPSTYRDASYSAAVVIAITIAALGLANFISWSTIKRVSLSGRSRERREKMFLVLAVLCALLAAIDWTQGDIWGMIQSLGVGGLVGILYWALATEWI